MAECVSTDEQYGESSMKIQSACFICERLFDSGDVPIPICQKCRSILKALCTCPVSMVIKSNVDGGSCERDFSL